MKNIGLHKFENMRINVLSRIETDAKILMDEINTAKDNQECFMFDLIVDGYMELIKYSEIVVLV